MSKKFIYIAIVLLAFVTLSGCSSSQSKNGYCYEKGNLNVNIYDPVENPCKVNFRYRNLAKHAQKPVIDIIAYNAAEEVVRHDKVYFPEISSGTARQTSQVIECQGEDISRIYIRDARNASRCYGYKCSVLCGINGKSIRVVK